MANNENPVIEITKFQHLLAPNGGDLSPKALLMLRTTKVAFEKLIADLVKKREVIKRKILDAEDLEDYLLGKRYVATTWVNKMFKLELSLKKVNQDLVVARALYKEYFGVEDDDDTTTTSSTTVKPNSTTSSTTFNPNTTSTTINPNTTSTTMIPNSSSTTTINPNSTTTTVNPNSTTSSTTVQNMVTFKAVLKGDKEVPPNASNATGEAILVFNPVTRVAKLTVNFAGLTPSAAHIHKGAAGVAGPVQFLISHATNPMQFLSPPLAAAQQVDLDNGEYYVNIHTAAYPDGEIRGQLVRQC